MMKGDERVRRGVQLWFGAVGSLEIEGPFVNRRLLLEGVLNVAAVIGACWYMMRLRLCAHPLT